ncbi:tyrosine-protein phosphatase [Pedobacter hartonius]|uniref:protein-tyrosine-phosphatase n=1 Tax=Pedobacter hartonius TaxID=425514 RepID=A0A1H4FQY9_9SPHI|nr:CpsB/CapC family capsule biosynthesis tyrosine phosphatase [Pedobacter hartonius]SEA99098.1 Tyrosine-protein phosphatase YwqE [Pedobacter hartonius]
MFSFFKKENKVSDIEWLGVDIHSHLLPGIDDGSKSMEQSVNYIHQLQELGFSKLICTPHIYSDVYPNTPETILPVLSSVVASVAEAGLEIELGAAAEYMAESDFLAVEGLLTLKGNYILIEMSYLTETPNIDQIIFDLQIKGYRVILAHPERYGFYHKQSERYRRIKDSGCYLQLNLLSVLGYYGKGVQAIAESLLQDKLYDFAGTDLHHDKHLSMLSSAVRNGTLFKKIGKYEFGNKEIFS